MAHHATAMNAQPVPPKKYSAKDSLAISEPAQCGECYMTRIDMLDWSE